MLLSLVAGWASVVGLVVLELPSPTATPVYDTQADGFAASIVPAMVILGILVVAAIWTSKRPRTRQRRR